MRFKNLVATTLIGSTMLFAGAASAQQAFGKAEDAVKYRQSSFSVLAHHFGTLGAMARGKAPFDAKVAAENADVLAVVANLPWAAFGAGTEGGNSKAAIWQEKAQFDEKQQQFEAEASKLVAAAKSGDLDKLKAAFGPAAQTCKSCHDAYKNK